MKGFSVNVVFRGLVYLVFADRREPNTMAFRLQTFLKAGRQLTTKLHGAISDKNQLLVVLVPCSVWSCRTEILDKVG